MNSEQIIYKGRTWDVDNAQHCMELGGIPKLILECTLDNMYGVASMITGGSRNYPCVMPRIKKVIFHDPATIVFWMDGSKTVVKCGEGDAYDPEKGLAMAIAKRALGNEGNYYNEIRKRTEGYSEEDSVK